MKIRKSFIKGFSDKEKVLPVILKNLSSSLRSIEPFVD